MLSFVSIRLINKSRSRGKPMRVLVVSESTFTVRGHGVHSVFEECVAAISEMDDVELVSAIRSLGSSVILHSHTIGPVALGRMLIHRGMKVVTAHITPSSLIGSIRLARVILPLVNGYMRFVYDRADRILAVSEATAAELLALNVHAPITVSYNAIDDRPIQTLLEQRSELRESFGWQDQTVVLAVGQLQPRKGILEFIECAAALPSLRFIWIGGMPFGLLTARRGPILRACSESPDNVSFLGSMSRSDVFPYYVAADIFFLPSHHETFGLATLEAATAKLPLVLRDLECYRYWLGDAYLSGTDAKDYVNLLRRLGDQELRNSLGERAAQSAHNFGRAALIKGLQDAYGLASSLTNFRDSRIFRIGQISLDFSLCSFQF